MSHNEDTQVKRRKVFFLPGHDPIPPRHHSALFEREAERQGEISEFDLTLWRKKGAASYGWYTNMEIDDEDEILTDFELLFWSDVVKDTMSRTIIGSYAKLVKTVWVYVTSGAARRMLWLRKGPVLLGLYPIIMMLLQLLVAIVITFAMAAGIDVLLSRAFDGGVWVLLSAGLSEGNDPADFRIFSTIVTAVGIGAKIIIFSTIMRWFKRHDEKFFAHYLMHDLTFFAQDCGAYCQKMEVRLGQFGAQIAGALQDDSVDEVLLVAHSSGAHLGVTIMADLIRTGQVRSDGPKLAYLTLGQVVPMVSFLPNAKRLRADLAYLSMRNEVTWVDISAPADGCAFALCDAVAVSGVRPEGAQWPVVLSVAFSETLEPERWSAMQWRFFRLHFQYMCAFDIPSHYDYFQITAGPRTLADRYGDTASTPARIDVPASRHTSIFRTQPGAQITPAE